jgi:hypothetical protein
MSREERMALRESRQLQMNPLDTLARIGEPVANDHEDSSEPVTEEHDDSSEPMVDDAPGSISANDQPDHVIHESSYLQVETSVLPSPQELETSSEESPTKSTDIQPTHTHQPAAASIPESLHFME